MQKKFSKFSDKIVGKWNLLTFLLFSISFSAMAQTRPNPSTDNWQFSPGIVGTVILVVIVILIALFIMYSRINAYLDQHYQKTKLKKKEDLTRDLMELDSDEIDTVLEARKNALNYKLKGDELSGKEIANDSRGMVSRFTNEVEYPLADSKKESNVAFEISDELKKLILYNIGASVFWLIFGTLVGQYVGMKFVWPEMDNVSWLSFGRLRPVHTNAVFWGWASSAMVGLANFVIVRTSNTELYSYKIGWWAFRLMNLSVIAGSILLMSGINNGGGEYREYIWPAILPFALGLMLTLYNFYQTVSRRKIKEIYISNWYLFGGLIWTITIVIIAYLPNFQNGLGETVIQGYYMHQGVGMWFMTFTLGLIYYFLPSSLNKPIYSYSLGVLAFWTQMLFYTLIGTHHFIFSPLPWWLQTVAIVFSVGMFIPVVAGTTNFLMTMRGSWSEISKSYVLPFFLVGVIFYFVGSTQGSLQAFRFTNFVWHFNDFNVAHSHMTMYGIITFILWACIYSIVPKITGNNPKQFTVGVHFWLAFVGLFAYMMSMMIGGTLRGLSWIEGNPFLESITFMHSYWLWRAIGGSLMFFSHLVFAYNFYKMLVPSSKKAKITTTEFIKA